MTPRKLGRRFAALTIVDATDDKPNFVARLSSPAAENLLCIADFYGAG